jgi:hypothetical protein
MMLEEVQKWAVAQYEQNGGRKILVPGLENEAKNYQLLHGSFNTSKLLQD